MSDKIPFPSLLDNSAISSFKKCPTDWMYGSLQAIARKGGNIHLHFGGAYAAGLEAGRKAFYDEGIDEETALTIALDTATKFWGDYKIDENFAGAKNYERLIGALVEYFEQYPLSSDIIKPFRLANGKSAVEFTFAIPLPNVKHPETGDPILYGGRFDMLAERAGVLFVEDDKTASQLGSQWMRNWTLDAQFTGYCLIPGTEVLTPSGWLPIEQVTSYTQVMQWDHGELSFVLPTALHSPHHQGELYELSGKTHSVTTGNHRQLVFDTYTQKYKTFTTETLPMTSGALRLVSAGRKTRGLGLPVDFMRLLVAFQADGSWEDGTAMSFHFTKARKAARLEEILDALCIPYTKHSDSYSYRIGKNEEVSRLVYQYLGQEKLFDSWLLQLSGEALQVFIQELQFWDGTSRGSRGWMYFTTVEQNAQWVQTIAALTGHYSSRHEQAGWKSDKPHIRINITENCHHALHLHRKTAIPYDGKVYCLTVPSSYFLIRSSGKISVTGNCWAARDFGYPVAGAIIRGLSILKNGYGHAQAITYRPDWQIDRWLASTEHTVRLMIAYWEQGFFPLTLDKSACNSYGGCGYHQLCESPNPDAWIALNYEPKVWNPLAKGA